MVVIPTGSPAWLKANDFSSYGGSLTKKNFASRGAINPKTDVGAEAFSRIAADLAALARTAPFGVFAITCDDGTPGPPAITYAAMMTGVRTASYVGNAAPTGFPSAIRNGNGDITLTFSASYTDPYGITGAFALAQCKAQLCGATAGMATATILTPTTLQVKGFVAAGTAQSFAQFVVTVGP